MVSCARELVSDMNYDKRRHVQLYLRDCSKHLVEEKDNCEVEVVAHNTAELNPLNTEQMLMQTQMIAIAMMIVMLTLGLGKSNLRKRSTRR